jgi:hypothetical protein
MTEGMKMKFEPIKERCPICNSNILCEIEINLEDEPRYKRVSDWICRQGHKVEDKELLDRLEDSMKTFNLSSY